MHDLQALGFALEELKLYLDTHCDDGEAAALFTQYAGLYRNAMEQYQTQYGPLRAEDAVRDGNYRWLCGPWPWENNANEEG